MGQQRAEGFLSDPSIDSYKGSGSEPGLRHSVRSERPVHPIYREPWSRRYPRIRITDPVGLPLAME